MSPRRTQIGLLFLLTASSTTSFTVCQCARSRSPVRQHDLGLSSKWSGLFQEIVVKDEKGQKIAVGTVVRVAKEGLKAFQVNAKGQGSFNDKKEFVKADKKAAGAKYLALPVGLRGLVSRVYDVDEVSANYPIQVKFTPGENTDEGYDPPTAFLMHFLAEEVEAV